ncbi:MAG: DsbA family protein, partial [Gammaproteobacteria bacterium]
MKKIALITSLSMAGALCLSTTTLAATKTNGHSGDPALSPAQTKEIQQVVHDYLVNNPEVLVEASQALQQKEVAKMQSTARDAIGKNAKALFNDPVSPVIGNPNGNVTVVEFMDYQCGHCKEMSPIIEGIIKQDPELRVVIKQLPIFGESSEFAAKAALAAQKQGKFAAFHQALMKATAPLSHDSVMAIAKSVGLNTEQLQQDMKDDVFDQQLKANMQLAQTLGLVGTPAFIIGNRQNSKNAFMPGATSAQNMQQLINQVRG